jgi:Rrf2 family protein
MRLSTKIRYAARTLAQLASTQTVAPIPARQLAACQDISVKYLEHILGALRSAGFVRVVRGTCAGYELAQPADSFTLRDLLKSLEGPLD